MPKKPKQPKWKLPAKADVNNRGRKKTKTGPDFCHTRIAILCFLSCILALCAVILLQKKACLLLNQ